LGRTEKTTPFLTNFGLFFSLWPVERLAALVRRQVSVQQSNWDQVQVDHDADKEPFTKIGIANFVYYRHAIRQRKAGRIGGKVLDVDVLQPYLQADNPASPSSDQSERDLHKFLRDWATIAKTERLTIRSSQKCADGIYMWLSPRTDGEYGKLWWGMLRSYHELLALTAYRHSIGQLVAGLFPSDPCPLFSSSQKAALRRLLTVSKAFASAAWMPGLVEKATANQDKGFFQALQQGLAKELSDKHALASEQRMAIMLLWYLGGKEMPTRKAFQWELLRRGVLSEPMYPESFEALLSKLGLTDNNLTVA
jgi:hypothetical protein